MTEITLPLEFRSLEKFSHEWSLSTERQRNERRISASGIQELQEFYDAMMPRMEEILNYLNKYSLDSMPEDSKRLFYMTLSLAEVAPAIELFKQPTVVDGFDSRRLVPMPLPNQAP